MKSPTSALVIQVNKAAAHQLTEHMVAFKGSFVLHSNALEAAGMEKIESLHSRQQAKIPDFEEVPSQLNWTQTLFSSWELDALLALVKQSDNLAPQQQYSRKDFATLLGYYKYKAPRVLVPGQISSLEAKRKVVLALSYYSQNRQNMSEKALEILSDAMKHSDEEIKSHAILTLSYALLNNQKLPQDILDDFGPAVEKILVRIDVEQISKKVVLIAALATTAQTAAYSEKLNVLIHYLSPIKDRHSLYKKIKEPCGYHEQHQNLWNARLKYFIELAESGKLLSSNDLFKIIKSWGTRVGDEIKLQVAIALKAVIKNGQINFPSAQQAAVIKVLEDGLREHDREVLGNFSIASGLLLAQKEGDEYKPLKDAFSKSQTLVKKIALNTIDKYLEMPGKISTLEKRTLQDLFSKLEAGEEAEEVKQGAKFLMSKITNKLDNLADLLLKKDYCNEISKRLIVGAKGGKLSPEILVNLSIVIENKDNIYEHESRLNVLFALVEVAVLGRDIIPLVTLEAVSRSLADPADDVACAALNIISSYASKDMGFILNNKDLLPNLKQAFSHEIRKRNACVAARFILQEFNADPHTRFNFLFTAAYDLLAKSTDSAIQENAILILYHGAKKKFSNADFFPAWLVRILNVSMPPKLINLMLATIQIVIENKPEVRLRDDEIAKIISLLEINDELIHNNIQSLVCDYIKNNFSSDTHAEESLKRIESLLGNNVSMLPAVRILVSMVGCGLRVPPSVIYKTSLLLHAHPEIKEPAVWVLHKLVSRQPFDRATLVQLFNALPSEPAEGMGLILETIKIVYKKGDVQDMHLSENNCIHLTEKLTQPNAKNENRINALYVLNKASQSGRKLSLEVIASASIVLHSQLSKLQKRFLRLFKEQIKFYPALVAVMNNPIYESLRTIEQMIERQHFFELILEILSEATPWGYNLDGFTQDIIVNALYQNPNTTVRAKSYLALNRAKDSSLKEETQTARKLETAFLELESSMSKENVLTIFSLLEKSHQVTLNNLLSIESICKLDISDDFIDLLQVLARNKQNFTHATVECIVLAFSGPLGERLERLSLLVAEVLKYGSYDVLTQSFPTFEKIIMESGVNEEYLRVIESAAKKKYPVRAEIFAKIIDAIIHQNVQISRAAARAFYFIVRNLDVREISDVPGYLSSALKEVTDEEARNYLKRTMAKCSSLGSGIEKDIAEIMEKTSDTDVHEICLRYLDANREKELPDNALVEMSTLNQLLCGVKSAQYPASIADLDALVQKLTASLIQDDLPIFGEAFTAALAQIISLSNAHDKHRMLNALVNIIPNIKFSDHLLEEISYCCHRQDLYKPASHVLSIYLDSGKDLPAAAVSNLLKNMQGKPDSYVRIVALHLLRKVKNKEQDIGRILEVEDTCERVDGPQSTHKEVLQLIQLLSFQAQITPRHLITLLNATRRSRDLDTLAPFIEALTHVKESVDKNSHTLLLEWLFYFRFNCHFVSQRNAALVRINTAAQKLFYDPAHWVILSNLAIYTHTYRLRMSRETILRQQVSENIDHLCTYLLRSTEVNVLQFYKYADVLQKQISTNLNSNLLYRLEPFMIQHPEKITVSCLSALINTVVNENVTFSLRKECAAFLSYIVVHLDHIPPVLKERLSDLVETLSIKELHQDIAQIFESVTFKEPHAFVSGGMFISIKNSIRSLVPNAFKTLEISYIVQHLKQYFSTHNPQYRDFVAQVSHLPEIYQLRIFITIAARNSEHMHSLSYALISQKEMQRELICLDLRASIIEMETKSSLSFEGLSTEALSLLCLKQRREFLDSSQINSLLTMLKTMEEDGAARFVTPYDDLKFKFMRQKVARLFTGIGPYASDYQIIYDAINTLDWSISFLNDFFSILEPIENPDLLLGFIGFSQEYCTDFICLQHLVNERLQKKSSIKIDDFKKEIMQTIMHDKLSHVVYEIAYADSDDDTLKNAPLLINFYNPRMLRLIEEPEYFKKIYDFLELIDESRHGITFSELEIVLQAIDTCYSYHLPAKEFRPEECVRSTAHELRRLHTNKVEYCLKAIIANKDPDNNWLDDLKSNNDNISAKDIQNIEYIFKKMEEFLDRFSKFGTGEIKSWASQIKKTPINYFDNDQLAKILACINRGFILHREHALRSTQLIAIITLLRFNADKDPEHKGRLLQVLTGEGKSDIIAAVATIHALQGKTVDIITSHPELASRDAALYTSYYGAFNLTTASNHDEDYVKDEKPCYQKNIVYGDISQFQFDFLRHKYFFLKTRGNRDLNTVIVDEVDNMLVDETSKIAMLAQAMPNMDSLKIILVSIWHQLKIILENIYIVDNELYYPVDPKKTMLDELVQIDELIKIERLGVFLAIMLDEHVAMLMNPNSDQYIQIPVHLKAFANLQAPKWIAHAIDSHFLYEYERDYAIKSDRQQPLTIVPIDFANTGTIKNGTMWCDGLHQFLQIKHGLRMSEETLITNFISNVAYIKEYNHGILGLTGTLGSAQSCALLARNYHLDFVKIPTFQPKLFYDKIPGLIEDSEEAWMFATVSSAQREAHAGRAVLLLCETIDEAKMLETQMRTKQVKIKMYIDSDGSHSGLLNEALDVGVVLIATNLAGRGTDVKVSPKVIENGGLHVCFTFLPRNQRVEDQGFGRTSRRGEPGSGELILSRQNLEKYLAPVLIQKSLAVTKDLTMKMIKTLRDDVEALQISSFEENEWPEINIKDELFGKFRAFLEKLKNKEKQEKNSFSAFFTEKLSSFWSGYFGENVDDVENKNEFDDKFHEDYVQAKWNAIEERWGLWLKDKLNVEHIDIEKVRGEFLLFIETIEKEYAKNTVIKNPTYYIKYGNELLFRARQMGAFKGLISSKRTLYLAAIAAYDDAIQLDPNAYTAYYNKACALTDLQGKDYKQKVKENLKQVKGILNAQVLKQLDMIMAMYDMLPRHEVHHEHFYQQHCYIFQLIGELGTAIDGFSENVKRSEKLVHITVNSLSETNIFYDLDMTRALEKIKQITNGDVTVSFHDLRSYIDLSQRYQAEETIFDALSDQHKVNVHFKSERINHVTDKASVLKKLLPTNAVTDTLYNRIINSPAEQEAKTFLVDISARDLRIQHIISLISHENSVHDKIEISIENLSDQLAKELTSKYQETELYEYMSNAENVSASRYVAVTEKNKEYTLRFKRAKNTIEAITILTAVGELIKASSKKLLSAVFVVRFHQIKQEKACQIIDHAGVDLDISFMRLNKKQAITLMKVTKEYNQDAVFEITQLSCDLVIKLITDVHATQAPVEVKSRALSALLTNFQGSRVELEAYQNNGLIALYEAHELNPMPWRTIVLLSSLAAIEAAAGIACLFSLVGSPFATGLFLEMANDTMQIAGIIKTREFSRSAYMMQKTLSLAILSVTSGLAVAQAVKAARVARAAKASTDMSLTSVAVNNADTITIAALNTSHGTMHGQHISIHGIKHGMRTLVATGIRKGITTSANKATAEFGAFALKNMRPTIENIILVEFRKIFLSSAVKTLLLDILSNDRYYSRDTSIQRDKIENKMKVVIKSLSTVHLGFLKVDTDAFNKFQTEFIKALGDIKKSNISLEKIFVKRMGDLNVWIDENQAGEIIKILRKHKVVNEHGRIDLSPLLKDKHLFIGNISLLHQPNLELNDTAIDFGSYNAKKKDILSVCQTLFYSINDECFKERSHLLKASASIMLDEVCAALSSVGTFVNAAANQLSGKIATSALGKLHKQLAWAAMHGGEGQHHAQHHHHLRQKSNASWSRRKLKVHHGHKAYESKNVYSIRRPAQITHLSYPANAQHFYSHAKTIIKELSGKDIISLVKNNDIESKLNHLKRKISFDRHQMIAYSKKAAHKLSTVTFNLSKDVPAGDLLFMQQALLQKCELSLKKDLELAEIVLNEIKDDLSDKYDKLMDGLLSQKKKLIKLVLSLIIIEANLIKEMGALNVSTGNSKMTEGEVEAKAGELLNAVIDDIDNAEKIVSNYVFSIIRDTKNTSEYFHFLTDLILEYKKLKRGYSMQGAITKVLDKVVTPENATNFINALNKKDYSQCGKLMSEGKLGEKAFIAGSLIEGIVKIQLTSTEANARMQVLLAETLKFALEKNNTFGQKLLELAQERQRIPLEISKSFAEQVKSANETLAKAIDSGKERDKQLAEKALDLVKHAITTAGEITKSYASPKDSETIQSCIQANLEIANQLQITIRTFGEQQQSGTAKFLETVTEIARIVKGNNTSTSPANPLLTAASATGATATAQLASSSNSNNQTNNANAAKIHKENKYFTLLEEAGNFRIEIRYYEMNDDAQKDLINPALKKYLDNVHAERNDETKRIFELSMKNQNLAEKIYDTLCDTLKITVAPALAKK